MREVLARSIAHCILVVSVIAFMPVVFLGWEGGLFLVSEAISPKVAIGQMGLGIGVFIGPIAGLTAFILLARYLLRAKRYLLVSLVAGGVAFACLGGYIWFGRLGV